MFISVVLDFFLSFYHFTYLYSLISLFFLSSPVSTLFRLSSASFPLCSHFSFSVRLPFLCIYYLLNVSFYSLFSLYDFSTIISVSMSSFCLDTLVNPLYLAFIFFSILAWLPQYSRFSVFFFILCILTSFFSLSSFSISRIYISHLSLSLPLSSLPLSLYIRHSSSFLSSHFLPLSPFLSLFSLVFSSFSLKLMVKFILC